MSAYARKQGVVRYVQKTLRGKYRQSMQPESRKALADFARRHRRLPHRVPGVGSVPMYPFKLR